MIAIDRVQAVIDQAAAEGFVLQRASELPEAIDGLTDGEFKERDERDGIRTH